MNSGGNHPSPTFAIRYAATAMTAAMINDADTMIRLIAIGAALAMFVVLAAGKVRPALKVPLLGLLIGSSAYLLNSSTELQLQPEMYPGIDYFSLLTPFWMWLFARNLFERPPPAMLLWGFIAFFSVCWFCGSFIPATRPWGFYGIHIGSLLLVVDLIWNAWSGRGDDLIEKRRLIRLWLPVLVGVQSALVLVFEMIVGTNIAIPAVQLTNALLILALTLFGGIALMQTDAQLLVDVAGPQSGKTAAADTNAMSPSETVLKEKLDAAMADGFYRTPGLTISSLADHLNTPEHRLRALINQRLGHRNFSTFLNRHRIAEAKAILADRAKVDLPVLTIAMDLGYNSLATFNRAFRSEASETPTDFRKRAIGQN